MIKAFENINIKKSWVAVGSFDGVHLGHQALAIHLASEAHVKGNQAVVVTFSPNPAVYFKRAPLAYNLTSIEEREKLLCRLGIDKVIVLEFNQEIAELSARDFMQAMKERLGITRLLAGSNFALGRDRLGNITSLKELGMEIGYDVETIPAFELEGEAISSSQIRKALTDGKLEKANRRLGRPYSLEGRVIHGENRGNRLGFPTANLDVAPDRLLPAKGVYACQAIIDGRTYLAATNIGVRPTFENPLPSPRIEPHLLDVKEDFYGHFVKLDLIHYLRAEMTFSSAQELIDQVNRDIQKTREILGHDQ